MATATIKIFGQLTDIINSDELVLQHVADTDSMILQLQQLYPALVTAKYVIAVKKQIINGNCVLNGETTIALLPPFSGG